MTFTWSFWDHMFTFHNKNFFWPGWQITFRCDRTIYYLVCPIARRRLLTPTWTSEPKEGRDVGGTDQRQVRGERRVGSGKKCDLTEEVTRVRVSTKLRDNWASIRRSGLQRLEVWVCKGRITSKGESSEISDRFSLRDRRKRRFVIQVKGTRVRVTHG